MESMCRDLDWNPLISAPLHSTFAGVLAGLVFAGIVVLLNRRTGHSRRANSLAIFGSAFLTLAFDSFLFGVISGEQVCARAWTETMLAAGLLGLGVLGMFAGTCWLVDDDDVASHKTTRMFLWITYFAAIIVGYHLAITASDYLRDFNRTGVAAPPSWLVTAVDIYKLAIVGLLVMLLVVSVTVRRHRSGARDDLQRSVSVAAYSYLICVLGTAVMAGWVAAFPKAAWAAVDEVLIVSSTLVALSLPAIAVIALLFALPSGRPSRPDQRHAIG